MKGKDELNDQKADKAKPFVVVAANGFDSGTFVFPDADDTDVPNVTVTDFNLRTIRFAIPRS